MKYVQTEVTSHFYGRSSCCVLILDVMEARDKHWAFVAEPADPPEVAAGAAEELRTLARVYHGPTRHHYHSHCALLVFGDDI